jgi:nucleolar protein 56
VQPFKSAENALSNINDISEGVMSEDLRAFLELNLPAASSKVRGSTWGD